MRLTAGAEIAAPQGFALACVADVEAHEALARARGLDVERLAGGGAPAWRVVLDLLGVRREAVLRLAAQGPDGLRLATEAAGVEGDVRLHLAPLGPERTRLDVAILLSARTLGARLALGSMRLGQGEIERRLQRGADAFAARTASAWAEGRAAMR